MSWKFEQIVDFNKVNTQKFRVESLITQPSVTAPDAGYLYLNSTDGYPYLYNGSVWYNLAVGSSDVWRKNDGVTPANSYTEIIKHNGPVSLNGQPFDPGYTNAFGSTKIGSIGIGSNLVETDGITSWLVLRGNQGVHIQQVNQNVGNVRIGRTDLGTMAGDQVGDTNINAGRNWTYSVSQTSNPNISGIIITDIVNFTNVGAGTRTFSSIKIAPSLTNVTEHFAMNGTGMLRMTDYGSGTISGTPAKFAMWEAGGKLIEVALGASGSFTAQSGETVTVVNGIITSIV